jgi:hypothetical protein
MNRPPIDIEAEVVDSNDAAKGSNQIANLENGLFDWLHRRSSIIPTKKRGISTRLARSRRTGKAEPPSITTRPRI